ncbi:hypothetical protein OROHE_009514 [Orobanche hederae]
MLNTMSLLRRRILAAANRMMSTYRAAVSFNSPRSPWLVLPPRLCKESAGAIFNFWCCAQRREYLFRDAKKNSRYGGDNLMDHEEAHQLRVLGSSPGWLACQRGNDDLIVLDPVSYDAVDLLPPWIHYDMDLETLLFSDSERKAFVICGPSRSLAFCSTSTRCLRREWTFFGGDDEYESMVYSTGHRRLFCITSALKLEAWDVGHHSPRLDWVAYFDCPDPVNWDWLHVQYLACEEQSGKLFLVVRKVCNIDYLSEKDFTLEFKVYRIDRGGLDLILMRDSLEGITFFVGSNQAIAIRDVGAGVEPDSVYFTYDRRLGFNSFVGNFDYRRRSISPVSCPFADNTCKVWFTPHPRHIILFD